MKYYVFLENKCSYFSKCLKRRAGLDFIICDVNKNPICTISGRNNKDFGAFFEDSYSYEINFPPNADADTVLTILLCDKVILSKIMKKNTALNSVGKDNLP